MKARQLAGPSCLIPRSGIGRLKSPLHIGRRGACLALHRARLGRSCRRAAVGLLFQPQRGHLVRVAPVLGFYLVLDAEDAVHRTPSLTAAFPANSRQEPTQCSHWRPRKAAVQRRSEGSSLLFAQVRSIAGLGNITLYLRPTPNHYQQRQRFLT